MYDELVKKIRHCATDPMHCLSCGEDKDGRCFARLMTQAADAIEELSKDRNNWKGTAKEEREMYWHWFDNYQKDVPSWIPVTEQLPSDFVSVQAHMTDAGYFPPVREAYVVNENWFFPALKEFHPVDMWKRFDEPQKEKRLCGGKTIF